MYGTDWIQVRVSASFSVARCSRPMCGSARWTTSPSNSSTRRSTPCAAGCCGPKFRVKLRISAMCRIPVGVFAHDARGVLARLDSDWLIDHSCLIGVVTHFNVTGNREVLAERMADEAIVGQYATQVVVSDEGNTVGIECFALEPVGTRPHAGNGIDRRKTFAFGEYANPQAPVVCNGEEMHDDGKAGTLPGTISVGRIINATEIDHLFKTESGLVAQCLHYAEIISRADFDG